MKIYAPVIPYIFMNCFLFVSSSGSEQSTTQSATYRRLSEDKQRAVMWNKLTVFPKISLQQCGSRCLQRQPECKAFARTGQRDCTILGCLRNLSGLPWVCDGVECEIVYAIEGIVLEMMVFRLTSGQHIPALDTWRFTPPTSLEQGKISRAFNLSDPFKDTFYRHPLVDNWGDWNILTVIFSLYTESQEVLRLELNGTKTTSTSWFSLSKVISSPWTDLNTHARYFTIGSPRGGSQRHFYINTEFAGCPNDMGWLVVFDNSDGCGYSEYQNYPVFVYVTGSQRRKWETAEKNGMAQDLVISVWLRL